MIEQMDKSKLSANSQILSSTDGAENDNQDQYLRTNVIDVFGMARLVCTSVLTRHLARMVDRKKCCEDNVAQYATKSNDIHQKLTFGMENRTKLHNT
jgi:hypothetical protein